MSTCKDCIHEKVCDNLIAHGLPWKDGKYPAEEFCDFFKNKADVVPRAEVEKLKQAYANYEETSGLKQAKAEVAREIFEEIEKLSHRFMNDEHYIFGDMVWDIAELKKKYTEGEDEV